MKCIFRILLVIATASSAFCQSASPRRKTPDYVLVCHGITSTSLSLKKDGPQAKTQTSTDEIRLERFGTLLKVQVNTKQYKTMDASSRKILEEPDRYTVLGETGEGLVATHVSASTTLHTLTIDRSLTNALWTESGFSFLEPQSQPISDSVYFTCTREKKK